MTRSIKSAVPTALLVIMLSAAPSYAAGRQNRDQGGDSRNPVQRIVQIVKRVVFGVQAHDGIVVPHP